MLRLAEDAYRLGGPDSLDAVSTLATGLIAAGRHPEAAGLFDGDLVRGLLRQARLGEDLPAHPAVGYLGQSLMFAERHDDAEVLLRAAVDGCRRQGAAHALAYPLAALSDLLRRTGRWVEATTCGAEAAALAEETGQSVLGGFAGNCVAWLRAMQGDTAGCDQLVETSFAVASATGALLLRLHGLAVYGMARLAAGQVDDAVQMLREADLLAAETGTAELSLGLRADLVEALARCGALADARVALDRLNARAEQARSGWGQAAAARCRAMLSADDETADRLFRQAVAGHPSGAFDQGRALLSLGGTSAAAGQSDLPAPSGAGSGHLRRLRGAPWSQRARAELTAAGVSAPAAPASALGS